MLERVETLVQVNFQVPKEPAVARVAVNRLVRERWHTDLDFVNSLKSCCLRLKVFVDQPAGRWIDTVPEFRSQLWIFTPMTAEA